MSITSTGSPGLLERGPVVPSDVLARIAGDGPDVDGNATFDARGLLRDLAEAGLLDLGLPGSAGSYADQARVIADLAAVCMTSAFAAWAHRMTVEYLVGHGGALLADLADDVRAARRPGSTALAGTFRAAAGVAEIPVRVDGGSASGFISWASNLYADAVVVTGVGEGETKRMVAFDLVADGVDVLPVTGLLALDATRSGAITLDAVDSTRLRPLATTFDTFVTAVRPTFLVLQSAFALGLASASLAAVGALEGPASALEADVSDARAELARLAAVLDESTSLLDRGEQPTIRTSLELRLGASHLATRATQLELAVKGGSAYRASSPTARRVREALFLPVQSPTEVQLQWELQQIS
jgi:hypothetical protein